MSHVVKVNRNGIHFMEFDRFDSYLNVFACGSRLFALLLRTIEKDSVDAAFLRRLVCLYRYDLLKAHCSFLRLSKSVDTDPVEEFRSHQPLFILPLLALLLFFMVVHGVDEQFLPWLVAKHCSSCLFLAIR